MNFNSRTTYLFLVLCTFHIYLCWAARGRSRLSFRPPAKRPSHTPTSHSHQPSASHNSPNHPQYPPSHATSKPASNYGWNIPSQSYPPSDKPNPNIGWNIPPRHNTPPKSSETHTSNSPSPWTIPGRESPYSKQQTGNQQSAINPSSASSNGPIGWNPELTKQTNNGQQKHVGWNVDNTDQINKNHVEQQHNSQSQGPSRPYSTPGSQPGQYHTNYQPGYQPGTYAYQSPPHGFNPNGPHTTIINNNYHPPPVYYPAYHYSRQDTGDSALGFFLGYSLGHITTPTFHYYGHHHSYKPTYDHYEVHHYYHNNSTTPKKTEIQPNTIVVCIGDSGSFCPPSTYALCTSSGSVMCVANVTETVPCTNNKWANCVRSNLPCVANKTEDCQEKNREATAVNIPCLYTTKVFGNITFVNNTIVVVQSQEPKKIDTNETMLQILPLEKNTTSPNGTASTENPKNSSQSFVTTTESTNNTALTVTLVENKNNSTESPIMTTTLYPSLSRTARSTSPVLPQKYFCVAIVAEPAVRKNLTEGERFFSDASYLLKKFAVKALGIDRI